VSTPNKIVPQDVSVRFFEKEDINDILNYFLHSPPGFLESIGLRESKRTDAEFYEAYEKYLAKDASENRKPGIVTVFYRNEKIGFHTSTDFVPNEHLVIHAHFFNTKWRKRGIGTVSGILAAELFLKEFNLKKIIAKVPLQNKGPLRILEKLGVPAIREEVIDMAQLIGPMPAAVYEGDIETIKRLKVAVGLAGS
jgi:RimJ/RimL family protein N-acetyltransferase